MAVEVLMGHVGEEPELVGRVGPGEQMSFYDELGPIEGDLFLISCPTDSTKPVPVFMIPPVLRQSSLTTPPSLLTELWNDSAVGIETVTRTVDPLDRFRHLFWKMPDMVVDNTRILRQEPLRWLMSTALQDQLIVTIQRMADSTSGKL